MLCDNVFPFLVNFLSSLPCEFCRIAPLFSNLEIRRGIFMADGHFPLTLHSTWVLVGLTGRLRFFITSEGYLFPLIFNSSVFLALYSHLSILFANIVCPFYSLFLPSGAYFLTSSLVYSDCLHYVFLWQTDFCRVVNGVKLPPYFCLCHWLSVFKGERPSWVFPGCSFIAHLCTQSSVSVCLWGEGSVCLSTGSVTHFRLRWKALV